MYHRNSVFIKTEPQLANLKAKASAGSGEAAWLVFQHYALGLGDEGRAEEWLQLAARVGNADAKKYIEIRSGRRH
jgi:TPR repeat protein